MRAEVAIRTLLMTRRDADNVDVAITAAMVGCFLDLQRHHAGQHTSESHHVLLRSLFENSNRTFLAEDIVSGFGHGFLDGFGDLVRDTGGTTAKRFVTGQEPTGF